MVRRRRRFDPFDRRSFAQSFLLHVLLIAAVWASTALTGPPEIEFITYEIEIVSPPPARTAEEVVEAREELVVERPDPEPTPPEPEPEEIVPVQAEDDPEPEPEPEEPAETTPPEAAEEAVVAEAPTEVEEETEESGEGIEVRMAGLQRDYPEYYNNIILQIRRCFRPGNEGNLQATVDFYILRDGSVEDMSLLSRSGSARFDFQAMGAVECAGSRAAFGPLPDDLPYDRFPIRFTFRPQGEDGAAGGTGPSQ